jgi:hypothetical protein
MKTSRFKKAADRMMARRFGIGGTVAAEDRATLTIANQGRFWYSYILKL